ncbi:MAG: metallophosphoesterase, partial [Clostridia bacterium]|nr:metallophosphoesterase [Deltaproteobacteria bacterium]
MSSPVKLCWSAVGDAQTSFSHFMRVLRTGGIVDDYALRPGIGLVCVGDYFDYGAVDDANVAMVGREGTQTLRWLAGQPADRVIILLGNHDIARVMELAYETDATFRAAQYLAREVATDLANRDEFITRYPNIPTPEVALRDFSTFAVEQRQLVQELLIARRVTLAASGVLDGKPVLITHAAVPTHDLEAIGMEPTTDVSAIASAVNAFLDAAVDAVAPLWQLGEEAALDLAPL